MRSTFKVLFYVKKGSEKPNGNLPLMCRITVDGEIKQFSCKMDVPPRLWDVKNSRASGKSVEAQRINLAVDKIRVEVNRRYQELMQCSKKTLHRFFYPIAQRKIRKERSDFAAQRICLNKM